MLLFVGGWTMMTMAMMLPTTLPLLMVFRKITSEKVDKAILVTLLTGVTLSRGLFSACLSTSRN